MHSAELSAVPLFSRPYIYGDFLLADGAMLLRMLTIVVEAADGWTTLVRTLSVCRRMHSICW